MSKIGQKIVERIAALPEEDQEAVEDAVLNTIDWLADMKTGLTRSEEDIKAGRVSDADLVFERILARYAS